MTRPLRAKARDTLPIRYCGSRVKGAIPDDLSPDRARIKADHDRPRVRGECPTQRPCPYVGCRHHLALEVSSAGAICWRLPGVSLEDLHDTCSLDVAERGGATLEIVGALLGVTRERARQIQAIAEARLRALLTDGACSQCGARYDDGESHCDHVKACASCEALFETVQRSDEACSEECRRELARLEAERRARAAIAVVRAERVCVWCASPYTARSHHQAFCSPSCKHASRRARKSVSLPIAGRCERCGIRFIGPLASQPGRRYCGDPCRDAARAERRRAKKRGIAIDPRDPRKKICPGCEQPFDRVTRSGKRSSRRYCGDDCANKARAAASSGRARGGGDDEA